MNPYIIYSREEWKRLGDGLPLSFSEEEIAKFRGLGESLSLREVRDIYVPIAKLLNLHVKASQELFRASQSFLGGTETKVPYVIGIAGSVAAGKSTTARVLQALLSRFPEHPKVDLVTTDGFLYPNRTLEERGLMKRKGFPESYDTRRLIGFLANIKSGAAETACPLYSHVAYDIVPDKVQIVSSPDVVIVEGLNILQAPGTGVSRQAPRVFVSDFLDFSIYVDADEAQLERWYVERFQLLREGAFRHPESYFRKYAGLSPEEAEETALRIWREINAVNLRENILPTKGRARCILTKGPGHLVEYVKLRKL